MTSLTIRFWRYLNRTLWHWLNEMLFLTAIPAVLQEFLAALPIQVQGKISELPATIPFLAHIREWLSELHVALWLVVIGLVIAAVRAWDDTTFVEDPRFWKRLTRKTRRRLAKRLARIGTGLSVSVHPQSQSDAQWLAHELADVMRVAHWTATVLETSYGGMRVKMGVVVSANQNHVEAAKQLVDSLHSIEISAVFDPNTDIVRESDLRITIGSRPSPAEGCLGGERALGPSIGAKRRPTQKPVHLAVLFERGSSQAR
ncbi:MAG: hypothetical protein WAL68_15165 [Candidatus Binatus sp.]